MQVAEVAVIVVVSEAGSPMQVPAARLLDESLLGSTRL